MLKKALILLLTLTVIAGILAYSFFQPDLDKKELISKYTDQNSSFIDIDGTRVHYRVEGNGPDLLLIHGTASSLHTWNGWVNELSSDFRIIRLDLPGFGLTGPHSDRNYSAQFYTGFVSEFLDSLRIDSVYVAGNSLGGNIVWNLALTDSSRVKKLILIDPSGYPDETTPTIIRLARTPVISGLLRYVTPKFVIRGNIKGVYYRDDRVTEELVDRYYDLSLFPGNRQAFIDKSRQKTTDRSHLIPSLKIPVLIQWGEYDEWIPLVNAYRFHEALPQSELILYQAGHVPMEEIPELTASDARSFLLSQ
ncbi:alpha/beta fold hydrolase [Balneola sp. MJW-20]|uniref:alpha/beta fold hydrolase n=1 Tax=Gracilimonas aurantiaca TaxID=3234185 RepID=UPI00346738A9